LILEESGKIPGGSQRSRSNNKGVGKCTNTCNHTKGEIEISENS
jgi:hypothetical protein